MLDAHNWAQRRQKHHFSIYQRSYEGRLPGGGTVELRLESQKARWGGVEVLERENIPGAKGEVNSSNTE